MQRSNRKAHFIPLPFATGAVGLLLGVAIPRGLSGGEGFLIGFFVGVVIMLVEVLAKFDIWQIVKNLESSKSKSQKIDYGR
ncbi:MAG: hypothetical protein QOD11_540 [Bradyrhizobium sp.]|jgi:hypothetical protein|nr:hypothetical protein [Bradyrhizobium sp.]